jgi:transposase
MNFYTGVHPYYCGVDLHARTMYLCILDEHGQIVLHRNLPTEAKAFLQAITPYRQGLVVAVECVFCWYWLADLCRDEGIDFILGHALYMKAVHGGKTKNDRQDAYTIAALVRGGTFPLAYAYPPAWRPTRDLLRRRNHLMRKRAELLAHIQNTVTQYNLPPLNKKIAYKANRADVARHFPDPEVRKSVEVDLALIDHYDELLRDLELHLARAAKVHDGQMFYLLRSIPGVGKILALVLMYEIHDIDRFPSVQDFTSYCRLVKPSRTSAGKRYGTSGKKIGSAHLKWAFSEAAQLFLRGNEPGQKYFQRLVAKYGKGKALSVLAHKLGRAVYYMLKRNEAFDVGLFLSRS